MVKELKQQLKTEREELNRRFRLVTKVIEALEKYEEEFKLNSWRLDHNFEWAMGQMRQGKSVTRQCWTNRVLHSNIALNCFKIKDIINGIESTWNITTIDLFATDWRVWKE